MQRSSPNFFSLLFCQKKDKFEKVTYFALRAQKIATDEYSFALLAALLRKQNFVENLKIDGQTYAVFTGVQLINWFLTHEEWKQTITKEQAGFYKQEIPPLLYYLFSKLCNIKSKIPVQMSVELTKREYIYNWKNTLKLLPSNFSRTEVVFYFAEKVSSIEQPISQTTQNFWKK